MKKRKAKKGIFSIDTTDGKRFCYKTVSWRFFKKKALSLGKKVERVGWSNAYDGFGNPTPNREYLKKNIEMAIEFANMYCQRGSNF